jgi:GNAT superfamily N-acetyltransferase
VKALVAFDRKVFRGDAFDAEEWEQYESYWMIVDGERVGCCAFKRNTDSCDDPDEDCPPRRGSLYIATTGILPERQRGGLGKRFKRWQIAWARRHGFTHIVTNCRASKKAIIGLNEKYGFTITGTITKYYDHPTEDSVRMELRLPPRHRHGSQSRIREILEILIAERGRLDRAIEILIAK